MWNEAVLQGTIPALAYIQCIRNSNQEPPEYKLHGLQISAVKLDEMTSAVFWVFGSCRLVGFRGAYCLHHQGDDGGSKHF
jgi:hypothetical protein